MRAELGVHIDKAVAYAQRHALDACVIWLGDKLCAEIYTSAFAANDAHPLYSGTKSFWGPAAILAQQDGILSLDELVTETITEWRGEKDKKTITVRMLLSLTAGFGFGGLGASVPTYDRAIAAPLKNKPGAMFTYGGIPLQIFGAMFSRKLTQRKITPHEYLQSRLLKGAGVSVASWRLLKDDTHPLPTGACLTAENWLAYGKYVNAHRTEFEECFRGSKANARYGLGWWLGAKTAPNDLAYASGSGGQAMYLVPSIQLVAVRFGSSASYKHEAFLRALFEN